MLLAPSPRKATVRPASVPLCSRTVSRSARIWQGWKSSVSALTTGTPAWAAISSSAVCAKVRHDDRRRLPAQHPGDVRDRLALADAGQRAVDDHRVAAELGDAGRERHLGAQGRLVEQHRHGARARPAARRTAPPSASAARSSTAPCSAGREVVVGEEVARHGLLAVRWRSASAVRVEDARPGAPTNSSSSSAVRTSGRREPDAVRATGVDDEPGVAGPRRRPRPDAGRRPARSPCSRPAPAHPGDQRVAASADRAQVLPELGRVVEQPVALDGVEHRQRGGAGDRVAAEGASRGCPGSNRCGRGARGRRSAPIGMPPPRPLASGDDVGRDAAWAGRRTTSPVRPMPVCTSSSTAARRARRVISRAAAR